MRAAELIWGLYAKTHRYFRNPPPQPERIARSAVGMLQVMGTSIMVLNYFWFSKMLRGALKVFGSKSKSALQNGGDNSSAAASTSEAAAAEEKPMEPAPGDVAPDPHAPSVSGAFAASGSPRLDNEPGQEDIEVIDIPEGDL